MVIIIVIVVVIVVVVLAVITLHWTTYTRARVLCQSRPLRQPYKTR